MTTVQQEHMAVAKALENVLAQLVVAAEADPTAAVSPGRDRGDQWPHTRLGPLLRRLGLSPFEQDVFLMALGLEADSSFGAVCASVGGATFGLALAAFDDPEWQALAPGAPLRWWRLIELSPGASVASAPIRVDDSLIGLISGQDYRDPRLEPLEARIGDEPLTRSQQTACQQAAGLWSASPVVALRLLGRDGAPLVGAAQAVCEALGHPVSLVISSVALPPPGPELDTALRLCERRAVIDDGVVVLTGPADASPSVSRFVDRLNTRLILALDGPWSPQVRAIVSAEIDKPTLAEQAELWGGAGLQPDEVARLAGQFDLEAKTILEVTAQAQATGTAPCLSTLWGGARRAVRHRLDDLAQRLPTKVGWESLVLPEAQMRGLRLLAAQAGVKAKVFDDWGFGDHGHRGLGVTALFAGSSGTGKTTAAEVLACERGLDLYRVDLSAVVSKYIGETEKNLKRLFDAAEDGGAVLLFDEADALFSKRVDTRDGLDRNANLEVSYLLQRLESFRGLAILTTNMRQSIDTAFWRRFSVVITFPFPDERQRAAIWRTVFPAKAQVEQLDHARLGQLTLSGGQIRSVALNAALLAAHDQRAITMDLLLDAARLEYGKQHTSPTPVELRGWPV